MFSNVEIEIFHMVLEISTYKLIYYIVVCTGCLGMKYSVADYQYFKNGNTQQCNIFRHYKYNFYLVVYKVSTPYVKC